MIKNIVFDIGNVLVDFNLKGFLAAKGFEPEMIKRILKASIMSPYCCQTCRCDVSLIWSNNQTLVFSLHKALRRPSFSRVFSRVSFL